MTTSNRNLLPVVPRAVVAVAGNDIDLVPLMGSLDDLHPLEANQWVSALGRTDVVVGEIAYTHGFGNTRRGVITKVGPKRITVAFTTPSTVATARRNNWGITIYTPSHPARLIRVFRPAGGAA